MANSVQNSVKMCRLKVSTTAVDLIDWIWQIEKGDAELERLREFSIMNQSVVIRSSFCPTISRWPGSHSIVTGSEDNIVYIYNLDKSGEPWCNMLQGHEV